MYLISRNNQHINHIPQQICRIIILLEINATTIIKLDVSNHDHERVEPFVPLPGKPLKSIEGLLQKTHLIFCPS